MTIRLLILIIFSVVFSIKLSAGTHPRKIFKPLKYSCHKAKISHLVHYFDSISYGHAIALGLSNDKNEIRFINYDIHSDQTITLNNTLSKDTLEKFPINFADIMYIKQELERTRCKSIKTTHSNNHRFIELILSQNFFMDNCKGLIFLTKRADSESLPKYYKKINKTTLYYGHLNYL